MSLDVFDVYAKLTLDSSEYDRSIEDAKDQANVFASVLGANLATKGIGLAVEGLKKLGEVAVDTFKKAMNAYADYEQLVGGVETLFKDSADIVQGYAAEAFRTAGLSANEYMETVTSFSAALIQSLEGDTRQAAEIADMAIRDMSDNANKMGTSMSSIQTAYQGFAKQNYTMLDNLKLGYGGTKEEMERLLERAEELKAQQGELTEYSIESYADIVEAIHVVQDEMGITGTTAKEGGNTISGSIATVKAAWNNLVANLGNDKADISKLIDDLFNAAKTAWNNIEPVAQQVLDGVINMIIEGLPKFVDLGFQIAGAILKGIALSPLKLLGKVLQSLGLYGQEDTYHVNMPTYSAPAAAASSVSSVYAPTVTTASGESIAAGASWQTQEFYDSLRGGVTININGDVNDDERSMREKMRTAVRDVIDEELAHG